MTAFVVNQTRGNIKKMIRGNLVFIDSSINEVVVLSQIFYSLQRSKYPPLWVIPSSLKVPIPNTRILTTLSTVYPLHLTILYNRNETKRVSLMLQV